MVLDTQMVLAILRQTDLDLPPAIASRLREPKNNFVSVASIWEIAIKHRIGKLSISFNLNRLPHILEEIGIAILDIEPKHTLADIGPEPITKDPFDRLLLGVCAAEGMKLLTIDKALVDHPLTWR
jgi:PIN domain nuclease of toxin-antitoxin system